MDPGLRTLNSPGGEGGLQCEIDELSLAVCLLLLLALSQSINQSINQSLLAHWCRQGEGHG